MEKRRNASARLFSFSPLILLALSPFPSAVTEGNELNAFKELLICMAFFALEILGLWLIVTRPKGTRPKNFRF